MDRLPWRFFILPVLISGLILMSGCVQKSNEKNHVPEPASSPQTPIMETPPGPDPFSGPPELQSCLREKLGDRVFNDLAMHKRTATPEEKAVIEDCIKQFESVKNLPPEVQKTPVKYADLKWRPSGVAIKGRYADAEIVEIVNGNYRMYFGKEPEVAEGRLKIFSAISEDGITWEKEEGIRIEEAVFPDIVKLPDGKFRMYFQRGNVIMSAISEDGLVWKDEPGIRIERGGHNGLDDLGVGASTTIRIDDGRYLMVYRTEKSQRYCDHSPNPSSTFLFHAISEDGLNFEKRGMVIDSRNDEFCDLVDGPELVKWDDGQIHLFFWSHRGVYESIYENGTFSKPELVFPRTPGEDPPADPTFIKIGNDWYMYYGQHGKGIFYARFQR